MPSSGVQTCALDRKSTRLNSSHTIISYAGFCLKKEPKQSLPSPLGGDPPRPPPPRVPALTRGADAPRARERMTVGGAISTFAGFFFFLSARGPRPWKYPPTGMVHDS